jgi:peptide/nickel transport system substrate-binding protein
MAHAKRVGLAISASLALTLSLAACGGDEGGNTGGTGGGTEAVKGGTVTVFHASDFEHLDPQRNFVTDSQMAGRLISRKLMEYKWDPKEKSVKLTNDLAAKVEKSADLKTWTFTLKDGLKYEDGSPITAADIKYGVERSYVPEMQEGAPYAAKFLACAPVAGGKYKGPYAPPGNNGGKGCTGIVAKDEKTVVFTLAEPNSEFDAVATMPTFTPVPQGKDTKTSYDNRVFSSGPYKIDTYTRKKTLVLSRNTNWDQKTDEIRTAMPDKFVFIFGSDEATVDQRLIANGQADQSAISFSAVQAANLSKITQANVKDRVVQGGDNCRRYIAFNQLKPIMQNQKFREALAVSFDKKAYITARGGEQLNAVVKSIIPEDLPGYHDTDPFGAPETGDVEKGKQLLAESGYKGETLKLGASDATDISVKAAESAQAAWKKIGVNIEVQKVPGDNYYTFQQSDKTATDLITAGWCYDWASLSTIVPSVFGPEDPNNPSGKAAQNNYARSRFGWDKMGPIAKNPDNKAAQEEYSNLYDEIMKTAPIVPISKDINVYVVGGNIAGATPDPNNGGLIDVSQIGVKKAG